MDGATAKALRGKADILREIDAKVPALTTAQQNLVAAFARGISAGYRLSAGLRQGACAHGESPGNRGCL